MQKEKKGIRSIGIENSKKGWVAVCLTEDDFEVKIYNSLAEICSRYFDSDSILVDVPLGLPESREDFNKRPEICFSALSSAGEVVMEPVYNSKHSGEGIMERVMLLERYCDQIHSILQYVNTHPELDQIMVDVVDALSLAVTGMIGVREEFKAIPEKPEKDSRGIKMEMVYAEPLHM